jgi:hypothetical protein
MNLDVLNDSPHFFLMITLNRGQTTQFGCGRGSRKGTELLTANYQRPYPAVNTNLLQGEMTPAKILGLLLVIVYIVALRILAVLDIHSVFEHRLLLPVLNTLFAGIIPIGVAYVAGKTYVNGGSVTTLFMGCGMLSFGLCAISAGWLIRATDSANLNLIVSNMGAFGGSLFHAIGAIVGVIDTGSSGAIKRRSRTISAAYVGVIISAVCLFVAALRGWMPPFFISGVGATDLRQAILGSSILLFALSSIFTMASYWRSRSDFLYWYSLCLSMLAIGLFGSFIQTAPGNPIGWLGRSGCYFGGVFALIAILKTLKDSRTQGISLEKAIADSLPSGGGNYWRGLLPVLPIPILLVFLVLLVPMDLSTVFEPPGLFAALNILFLTIFPLTVAYFATKGYLRSGLSTMLMLLFFTLNRLVFSDYLGRAS